MSAAWEVQQAMYTAMVADTTLTSLVTGGIYDEPLPDTTYPYITIGDMVEVPDNRHRYLGYDISHTIHIYTKPYGLGYSTAEQILARLNVVLNMKRFALTNYTMLICKFDRAMTDREGDKRIISARYNIICHSNTATTY
jgi:hypothetical protein